MCKIVTFTSIFYPQLQCLQFLIYLHILLIPHLQVNAFTMQLKQIEFSTRISKRPKCCNFWSWFVYFLLTDHRTCSIGEKNQSLGVSI